VVSSRVIIRAIMMSSYKHSQAHLRTLIIIKAALKNKQTPTITRINIKLVDRVSRM
jgi:hypothetical protein